MLQLTKFAENILNRQAKYTGITYEDEKDLSEIVYEYLENADACSAVIFYLEDCLDHENWDKLILGVHDYSDISFYLKKFVVNLKNYIELSNDNSDSGVVACDCMFQDTFYGFKLFIPKNKMPDYSGG